ncbi:MAG: RNA polymerase nonessential primary-like sigma factor, partial [Bermanella sp.]
MAAIKGLKKHEADSDLALADVEEEQAEKEEIVEIAKDTEVQKNLDATQLYLNEIGFSPLLTPEEEVHFARLARKGDEKGRKRMIESNLRLVVKISRRYVNRGLTLLDL